MCLARRRKKNGGLMKHSIAVADWRRAPLLHQRGPQRHFCPVATHRATNPVCDRPAMPRQHRSSPTSSNEVDHEGAPSSWNINYC